MLGKLCGLLLHFLIGDLFADLWQPLATQARMRSKIQKGFPLISLRKPLTAFRFFLLTSALIMFGSAHVLGLFPASRDQPTMPTKAALRCPMVPVGARDLDYFPCRRQ